MTVLNFSVDKIWFFVSLNNGFVFFSSENGSYLFLTKHQRCFSYLLRKRALPHRTTAVFISLQKTVVFYSSQDNGCFFHLFVEIGFFYSSPGNDYFLFVIRKHHRQQLFFFSKELRCFLFLPRQWVFFISLQATAVSFFWQTSTVFIFSRKWLFFISPQTQLWETLSVILLVYWVCAIKKRVNDTIFFIAICISNKSK